jgi:hypothetical protein
VRRFGQWGRPAPAQNAQPKEVIVVSELGGSQIDRRRRCRGRQQLAAGGGCAEQHHPAAARLSEFNVAGADELVIRHLAELLGQEGDRLLQRSARERGG